MNCINLVDLMVKELTELERVGMVTFGSFLSSGRSNNLEKKVHELKFDMPHPLFDCVTTFRAHYEQWGRTSNPNYVSHMTNVDIPRIAKS